ncbi:MAG: rhodanese-like domain-containing protein [Bdellovibrionales bacterium]|jgi:rhodanese-related sulfurtransferase|nr:rhodanese-like domain-containing protein [Bdellovibrionales bacterium]MBT3527018.1 rhodanese-like domain-containing protein [Bdellovibrionales bacterium]MBT7668014.1 rhodanese-like domain-containing protein [Bdellovibrionales bacterium]MBT7766493.1 rhodanese-like domain-containing protein [Bdellovibrionales bacterium]
MKQFILLALLIISSHSMFAAEIGNITASDAKGMIDNAHINGLNLVLLDVRTPEEFTNGHIRGAINVNYYDDDFMTQVRSLEILAGTDVIIYCRSGRRSLAAAKKMQVLEVVPYNMLGGIKAWVKEGYSVVK